MKFRNEDEARAWVQFAARPATNLGQADAFIEDYRERVGEPSGEPAFYCQFEDCTTDPHWCEEHVREMCVEARLEGKRQMMEVVVAQLMVIQNVVVNNASSSNTQQYAVVRAFKNIEEHFRKMQEQLGSKSEAHDEVSQLRFQRDNVRKELDQLRKDLQVAQDANRQARIKGQSDFVRDVVARLETIMRSERYLQNDLRAYVDELKETKWHHIAFTYDGSTDPDKIKVFLDPPGECIAMRIQRDNVRKECDKLRTENDTLRKANKRLSHQVDEERDSREGYRLEADRLRLEADRLRTELDCQGLTLRRMIDNLIVERDELRVENEGYRKEGEALVVEWQSSLKQDKEKQRLIDALQKQLDDFKQKVAALAEQKQERQS